MALCNSPFINRFYIPNNSKVLFKFPFNDVDTRVNLNAIGYIVHYNDTSLYPWKNTEEQIELIKTLKVTDITPL